MKSKKRLVITVVVLAILLTGGYALYQKRYGMISWAKEAVAAELADGDSAKFRNVRVINPIEVCGEVNAKNKFGAYVGFTAFLVVGSPSSKDAPLVQTGDSLVAPLTGSCRPTS